MLPQIIWSFENLGANIAETALGVPQTVNVRHVFANVAFFLEQLSTHGALISCDVTNLMNGTQMTSDVLS